MDEVYVCDVLHHETCGRPLDFEQPIEMAIPTFGSRNDRGEALPRECFATKIYGWSDDPSLEYGHFGGLENLPHMLRGHGVILSEQAASIFRQFDMGKGALYPVELYRHDRKTLFDIRFHLNFGTAKSGYLPLKSSITNARPGGIGGYYVPVTGLDYDISLSKNVLNRPDLWVDPQVRAAFFVSGELAKTLNAAGMQSDFNFKRCCILDQEGS